MQSLHLPSAFHRPAAGPATTMSSREIADLVGASHDSVLKTVRALIARGVVSGNETTYTHPQNGQTYPEFLLTFRDTMVVASGYSVELRARIIDRWQDLETTQDRPALPTTYLEALRELVATVEVVEQQQMIIAEQQPKVAAFERIADTDGMVLISDAAKVLQIDQKKLFAWLCSNRWIFRRGGSKRYIGFADKLRADYLKHKFDEVPMPDGSVAQKERVFLTPKGITKLATIFDREVA